jgi:uncharacterized membrane protein YbhN (UPF0104 family)
VTAREGSTRPGHEILGIERRKALVTLAGAVLLVAGVFALIGRAAHYDELLDVVRRADRAWLPVGLGGLLLAYSGYILAYRDVARVWGGPCFPYWTVARVVAIGFGANLVGSAAAGLAVDFWALRRAGVGLHDSVRRVLGLNTLEWGLLGVFAAVAGGIVLVQSGGKAPLGMAVSWLVVVPICLAAMAWVSSPRRADRLTSVLPVARPEGWRQLSAWARWLVTAGRKALADAIGGVVVVRHVVCCAHRYPAGLFGFPVYWLGHLLTLYAGLRAFAGSDVALAGLVLAFATGYAATALPLPGGGAGGIEAALTFSLHAVGLELAPALLGAVFYRIFTFWLPVVPALALLPTVGGLDQELPRTRREAPARA